MSQEDLKWIYLKYLNFLNKIVLHIFKNSSFNYSEPYSNVSLNSPLNPIIDLLIYKSAISAKIAD